MRIRIKRGQTLSLLLTPAERDAAVADDLAAFLDKLPLAGQGPQAATQPGD
jgi:hypothetical protein